MEIKACRGTLAAAEIMIRALTVGEGAPGVPEWVREDLNAAYRLRVAGERAYIAACEIVERYRRTAFRVRWDDDQTDALYALRRLARWLADEALDRETLRHTAVWEGALESLIDRVRSPS